MGSFSNDLTPGGPDSPDFGGEVTVRTGGSQPVWLMLLTVTLYAVAVVYLLMYAPETVVIRLFAVGLAIRVVYLVFSWLRGSSGRTARPAAPNVEETRGD